MKHLTTIIFILIIGNSFGQKRQCFCEKDTLMNEATTDCKTTVLKNKSKLYWQYTCDKIWLTLENINGKKVTINEVDVEYFSYTYRLGFHLIKEFNSSILFRSGCAANGPCIYTLIDKSTGKKVKEFGQLICIDNELNDEGYKYNFVAYLSDDKLNLYFVNTRKIISVPFSKSGLKSATPEYGLTNMTLKNNKVRIDYVSDINEKQLNVQKTLTIDLEKYSH